MRFLVFMLVIVFLPGCSTSPAPMGKPLPQLDFRSLAPVTVANGAVAIEGGDAKAGGNEVFIINPRAAINAYAENRFRTGGAVTRMIFDIRTAQITKTENAGAGFSLFDNNKREVYDMEILLYLTPLTRQGAVTQPYTIAMNRSLVLPYNTSLAEREFRQFEFLEKVIQDIDAAVMDIVTNKINPNF